MTIDHQPDGTDASGAATPPLTPRGAARRRMAGLGISGVVMTVASNNALADMVCKSPSGALSGNLNSHSPKTTCDGRSPKWWSENLSQWPSEVKPDDRLMQHFTDVRQPLANLKVSHILKGHPADVNGVNQQLMATYLNVLSQRITFLTRQSVLDMQARWARDRAFTPADGAHAWTGAELADYLSRTQSY